MAPVFEYGTEGAFDLIAGFSQRIAGRFVGNTITGNLELLGTAGRAIHNSRSLGVFRLAI